MIDRIKKKVHQQSELIVICVYSCRLISLLGFNFFTKDFVSYELYHTDSGIAPAEEGLRSRLLNI